MVDKEIIASIALTQVPGIGSVTAKHLLSWFNTPSAIFAANKPQLLQVEGIGTILAKTLLENRHQLEEAAKVVEKCQAKKIKILTLLDEEYPNRLKQIPDAPFVLYTAGDATHEPTRAISVVGTRKNTAYGKRQTHEIIEQLAATGITVISGLAFGIDTYAHKAALEFGLKTYAVLATPLDKVYPAQNRELAIDIFKTGRLYSEYAPGSVVDTRNFPMRNRIIAGLADATIVVEAGETGGALITATLSQDYDRQVFAVPGRIGDEASQGCLKLISKNQAAIFTSTQAFLEEMGWEQDKPVSAKKKAVLPTHLSKQETELLLLLDTPSGVHIDDISFRAAIPLNVLAGVLLKLEFDNLVVSIPGKKFRVSDAILGYVA